MFSGVVGDHVLPPVFLEGAFNAERYREVLRNEVTDFVDNLPLQDIATLIYQQDGHPAHRARESIAAVREIFGWRWLGIGSELHEWPPRSPELTIMDFFMWGHI